MCANTDSSTSITHLPIPDGKWHDKSRKGHQTLCLAATCTRGITVRVQRKGGEVGAPAAASPVMLSPHGTRHNDSRSDPATGFVTPTPIWQGARGAGLGGQHGSWMSPAPLPATPAHLISTPNNLSRSRRCGPLTVFLAGLHTDSLWPRSVPSMKMLSRVSCVDWQGRSWTDSPSMDGETEVNQGYFMCPASPHQGRRHDSNPEVPSFITTRLHCLNQEASLGDAAN